MRVKLLVICTVLFLTGCSNLPGLYADVGVGYQLDGLSDWYVSTERDYQCDTNAQAHLAVGYEFPKQYTLSYEHQSWFLCGRPINSHAEVTQDAIYLTKRFGGRK